MGTRSERWAVVGLVAASLMFAAGCTGVDLGAKYAAFTGTAKGRVARVEEVSSAPVVDGVLDDAYKKAEPLTFSLLAGAGDNPTCPTQVYALSTDKELFVFFNCLGQAPNTLRASVREHDGDLWGDDAVEIFIDPTNKRDMDSYYHITINPLGTTADAKGPGSDSGSSGWNPKLRVKAGKIDTKGWTVEIAIPFSDLVPDVSKMSRVWATNFNRLAWTGEGSRDYEDTAWSPTFSSSSHVPRNFGTLWLDAGSAEPAMMMKK